MSFVGHGWRSGQAADIAGPAATCTVTTLGTPTAPKGQTIMQTVNGTGFDATCVIHANYAPVATAYIDATHLRAPSFSTTPDSGVAGTIPIGVRKGTQALSNTVNFTAT
jgi:hypothetical protein